MLSRKNIITVALITAIIGAVMSAYSSDRFVKGFGFGLIVVSICFSGILGSMNIGKK